MTDGSDNVLDWLLEGDPAIRWQVVRDLTSAPQERVDHERGRVSRSAAGVRSCSSSRSPTVRSGSRHGSFHTSISALDALFEYQAAGGSIPVADSMSNGRSFFLAHRLWHSHSTGAG